MSSTAQAEPPKIIRLPRLYPKQHAVFFHPARIVICEASTKAGKTVGCIAWQLSEAFKTPDSSHLWVSMIYKQARIALSRVIRMFRRMDPEKKTGWDHKSGDDLYFKCPNGARVYFRGGDDPDSIYGPDYHSAVVDEASRCKEAVWAAVVSTLTATGGPVRVIGNVKGRQNWAYRLARKAEGGARNMAYFKLTALDAIEAGVIRQDTVDDAAELLPAAVFRELYYAEPSDDGGNPFGLQHIAACFERGGSDNDPAAFGVDLAKSQDWTVSIGIDEGGRVCRFQRWQRVPWSETERRVIEQIGDVPAFIDSTGVGDPVVEGIQRKASNVEGYHFTSRSKQQLMEGLAVAIQRHEIGFSDPVLKSELETFEFEYTATGVRYTAPEGLHDDTVMALGLAVMRWNRAGVYSGTVVLAGDERAAPYDPVKAREARVAASRAWDRAEDLDE